MHILLVDDEAELVSALAERLAMECSLPDAAVTDAASVFSRHFYGRKFTV